MRTEHKLKLNVKEAVAEFLKIVTVILLTSLFGTNNAPARSSGPHDSFLSGPWEIIVKMGFEGEGFRFPLAVSDENKPQKLGIILPVTETEINIKLDKYIPDLKQEIVATKHPGGGIVAKLAIKGRKLNQEILLCSEDPARQSISSRIGGVAIRRIRDVDKIETLVKNLTHRKAVGILSVWPEDSNEPVEFVAKISESISIPESKYKIKIIKYMPHYSIDTDTKKVINLSDEPVNPAIMVIVDDGQKTSEHWIWAKFPTAVHQDIRLPLRMRFTDFDLRGTDSRYILVVADEAEPWLLLSQKSKISAEKAVLGLSYPFENKEYSFNIIEIIDGAILKNEWKNNSERLWHPAVIATIEQNGIDRQTALELNKPFHYKTDSGTLVLLYRRVPTPLRDTNQI